MEKNTFSLHGLLVYKTIWFTSIQKYFIVARVKARPYCKRRGLGEQRIGALKNPDTDPGFFKRNICLCFPWRIIVQEQAAQQTQNICIHLYNVAPTSKTLVRRLYKCYANDLCFLGKPNKCRQQRDVSPMLG